jgi:hypothetical protein
MPEVSLEREPAIAAVVVKAVDENDWTAVTVTVGTAEVCEADCFGAPQLMTLSCPK